jgi:enamine deaminase RidA (YjgF/YER057c/UK114 family)
MSDPHTKLRALQLQLPPAPQAVASFEPLRWDGTLIYFSGQIATVDGRLAYTGQVGGAVTVEQGQECARACALNALAQLQAATGDLILVEKLVKLTIFVASAPRFDQQHVVANGASDLFLAVLGEEGRHARSAIGVAALPFESPVEIELIARASSRPADNSPRHLGSEREGDP